MNDNLIGFPNHPRTSCKVPVVYHPSYSAPELPASHRFPIKIFQNVHDLLVREAIVAPEKFHIPSTVPSRDDLCLAHAPDYVDNILNKSLGSAEVRRIGLPLDENFKWRTLYEISGTLLTAELALQHGIACNTAGGTHHAHSSFGSGFCFLNDLAVPQRFSPALPARPSFLPCCCRSAPCCSCAAAWCAGSSFWTWTCTRCLRCPLPPALPSSLTGPCLLWQGDGTAQVLAGEEAVFTFSMHCGANFPYRKQASDLDVDVPEGCTDQAYLQLLADHLPRVLRDFRPDLVIYDAGVDVHADDSLGKLCLTDSGLYRREMQVFDTCLGHGIPVAANIGGGYSRDLQELARRHCFLHVAANEVLSGQS